ncbi:hypothetical protein [Sphingomonas bisphenolicum]|uniref:Uncharacterized protein n=1 Tax=Sphingomonas bisphenolicum TaxID=296544 RepID=A0ABN5W966_9SPHN|nr:hypothetical protein [Sphingomonas bisphenolicum]BBF68834.1 hypothetical protein SBA_ch1_10340 [Sphingomonas bisphenolicum]
MSDLPENPAVPTERDLIEAIEDWQMETEGIWAMAEDLESEISLLRAFNHLVGFQNAREAMNLFIHVNHMPIKAVRGGGK